MAGNPYRAWVDGFVAALRAGEVINAPEPRASVPSPIRADAAKVLVFAPHPDDEVIVGGLPLRLMRERGFTVVNVAVTLGSKLERRAARWRELEAACAHLGFGLVTPDHNGLEGINLEAREQHPGRWTASVEAVAAVLATERPHVVFLPHAADWNRTHVGVHHLVIEAMRRLPSLTCLAVETEYWGTMSAPNLMVESSPADVADLVAALSLHAGEVARNAYHPRLPAWMMDNVRRGAEMIGGQGSPAPCFVFATLYRLRGWSEGGFHDALREAYAVSAEESLEKLFPAAMGATPWR